MSGMNRTTGQALDGMAHLRQSIADILTTPIGSRVMRRDYGSRLPELIDQPDHGATRVRLYGAIASVLMRWEPRLLLSAARIAAGTRPGQVVIDIEGVYRPVNGAPTHVALQVPLSPGVA